MKTTQTLSAALLTFSLFASPAFSEGEASIIDAIQTFDGCAAQTQSVQGFSMTMDINCIERATDYCAIGRPIEAQVSCVDALTQHVEKANIALRDTVPERLLADGVRSKIYARTYARLMSGDAPLCDHVPIENFPPDTWCTWLQTASDWTEWRSLQRQSLEDSK
jgi:hypothetical protein